MKLSGNYLTIDLRHPFAIAVFPPPARPISKTGWLMKMNFLIKYSVATLSFVGTEMLLMMSPLAVSKSTEPSIYDHSANLQGSMPPSEFLGFEI